MHHHVDENAKLRLTEPVDILTAVNIFRSRGLNNDDLLVEITKLFYVDLDEYNEIIRRK
jgi:hypothetical protein